MVRLPDWFNAQRKVPVEPSSAREVTVYTLPSAPPEVKRPAPDQVPVLAPVLLVPVGLVLLSALYPSKP